jgi:hypothetical protein
MKVILEIVCRTGGRLKTKSYHGLRVSVATPVAVEEASSL